MAIDWSNEPYTRLFKRDTDDDLVLSWEARAVWHEFLKHCDRSGVLETKRGARGLAAHVRIPADVVERVLPELLEDGRVRVYPVGFIAPNYLHANDAVRSDRARAAASRARRRSVALGTDSGSHGASAFANDENDSHGASDSSHGVTNGHTTSHDVTLISADQIRSVLADGAASLISEDWKPRERERELAADLGLDADAEAAEFVAYWIGEGKPKRDWNQTFVARLRAQAKRGRVRQPTEQVRRIPEL